MRIDKLILKRFGSFTDRTIDFGCFGDSDRELDLHLVYGPNEAGKSTLRTAVENFLYGIPRTTPYNFLHDSKALQIEAAISTAGQQHELIRIKRQASSLLSLDNQPVGDDFLRPLLSGVDREAFANMFSMDEDSLELGGNSILDSEGDLGELLFSSTSGIAALSGALSNVRLEAESFYKFRATKVELKEKTNRLQELKAQIKQLDVPANVFAARKKAEKQASAEHQEAADARKQHQLETARLKALIDCIEPWRDYLACEEHLASIPALPELPSTWLARAQMLAQESATVEARLEQLQSAIDNELSKKQDLELNRTWLNKGWQIDRLSADDTEAKYRASNNAEGARVALSSVDEQIQRSLRTLRPPEGIEAADLLLPAARVGQLRALIEQRASLDALLQVATEEQARANDALKATSEAHQKLEATGDYSEVERRVGVLREEALDKEFARQTKEVGDQQAVLNLALLALEPWQGDAGELRALVAPAASELTEAARKQRALEEQASQLEGEKHRLEAEVGQLEAQLSTLRARGDLIDDATAAQSRQRRDGQWLEHRQALEKNESKEKQTTSAERFETSLAEDDALSAARFAQSNELAELRSVEGQLARARAELSQIEAQTKVQKSLQAEFTQSLQQLSERLSLPANSAVADIEAWLIRRTEALREAQKLAHCQSENQQLKTQLAEQLATLQETLKTAGAGSGPEPVARSLRESLQIAESALGNFRERRQTEKELSANLKTKEQEFEERSKRLVETQNKVSAWDAQWQAALDGLWLQSADRTPLVAEVSEMLRTLDNLGALLDKRNESAAAVDAQQRNRTLYTAEVADIAEALGVGMNTDKPLETADELRNLLAAAREVERVLKETDAALEQLREQFNNERRQQSESQSLFAEMVAVFPADTHSELLAQMQRAQKRMSDKEQLDALQRQITRRLDFAEFEDAKALLCDRLADQSAIETLRVEYANAEAHETDLNETISRLYHEWQAAKEALAAIGDDDQVAVLNEQIQVLLEDIRADTQRYLALSAGTMVVDRALKTYLDKHRSTMLTRASAAFSTITRGAFTGLDAMPGVAGKSKEELVGIRANGSSTAAKEMSRGSRFQLYLSLRIAGYHEFVAAREPLPFFADDILETFDDDRSAETFGLMAEMAKSGQVIYLTHHEHLCEIAKRVTNNRVMIHELPARAIGSAASD